MSYPKHRNGFQRFIVRSMLTWCLCLPIAASSEGIRPNSIAPNFSRETLEDTKLTLSSFRGKVVLLNFWASWCGPCRIEMPSFVNWQHKYGSQGLQVVGVSMDDEDKDARNAYRMYSLNYPVVMGNAKLGELYGGVLGLPVTYLIDRHGIIRFRHQGVTDLKILEAEVKSLVENH